MDVDKNTLIDFAIKHPGCHMDCVLSPLTKSFAYTGKLLEDAYELFEKLERQNYRFYRLRIAHIPDSLRLELFNAIGKLQHRDAIAAAAIESKKIEARVKMENELRAERAIRDNAIAECERIYAQKKKEIEQTYADQLRDIAESADYETPNFSIDPEAEGLIKGQISEIVNTREEFKQSLLRDTLALNLRLIEDFFKHTKKETAE